MELQSGAGSWGCGSTWHGIVDGRVGCLDVALGVIDGGRVGRLEVGRCMWLMGGSPAWGTCSMEARAVRWLLWGVRLRWAG